MKHLIKYALIILVLSSCEDKNEFNIPLVQTGEVSEIRGDGALFNGKVLSWGNSEITEMGFVWSLEKEPSVENSDKIVVAGTGSVFSTRVSTSLIANEVYYVRAYIQTKSTITYGQQVNFKSLGSAAPTVVDFSPRQGNINETLIITGKNFSTKTNSNIIDFSGIRATVLKATNDSIWVTVPSYLAVSQSLISVSILGNKGTAPVPFGLFAPEPSEITPGSGSFDQEVAIKGANFLKNSASLKVSFNDEIAEIISVKDDEIRVKSPIVISTRVCNVFVTMNNLKVKAPGEFRFNEFVITDFSPKICVTGDRITISGSDFVPTLTGNKVTIGGHACEVVNATTTQLEVIVPLQEGRRYDSRDATVAVESLGTAQSFNETLYINDQWFRISDYPAELSYGTSTVRAGGQFFVGPTDHNLFYRFDPQTGTWTKQEDFPGTARMFAAMFSIGSNIYFGTGFDVFTYADLSDFWKFDTQSGTWTQLNDFAKPIGELASFSIGTKGYAMSGRTSGSYSGDGIAWEFDEATDQWKEMAVPEMVALGSAYRPAAVSIGNIAFLGPGNKLFFPSNPSELFLFNPSNPPGDEWLRISDFPNQPNAYYPNVGIDFDGVLMVKVSNGSFYRYEIDVDSWIQFPTRSLDESKVIAGFFGNGKLFLLQGDNEFWEFDPNR